MGAKIYLLFMFSGIIKSTGEIKGITPKQEGILLTLKSPERTHGIEIGSSIAINGVCLTVKDYTAQDITFEVMPETLRKTTVGGFQSGDRVNVENSLRVGDEIGGHDVFGHVDGVATVTDIVEDGNARRVTFAPPEHLKDFFTYQGAVAVDGVSLTVAALTDTTFTVSLIEHTWTVTTLGDLKIGDSVNIECDMTLKYVHRYLEQLMKANK